MKVAIVSPDNESEKALSKISMSIARNLQKNHVRADLITYKAGSPKSFIKTLFNLKRYRIVHIQHEYNLLGFYGLPFFVILPLIWLMNKKIVISMHTVLSQKEKIDKSFLKDFLRKKLYIFQNSLINLTSDLIIVNEQFFKNILVNQGSN